MDPFSRAQIILLCDLCKTAHLQSHCERCDISLCEVCVGKHLSNSSIRHKVVLYKYRKSLVYSKCPDHADKHCKYYCEKCDIPVCSTCASSSKHEDHKMLDILGKLDSKTEKLQKDLEELETRIYPRYEEMASDVLTEKAELETNYGKLTTAADRQGEILHREITAIVNQRKFDIQEMKNRHLSTLNKNTDEIALKIRELKQIIADLKSILKSNDVSLTSTYKSRNSEFRTLPPKVRVTLPSFSSHKINKNQLNEMFGSLPSEYKGTTKSLEAVSSTPVKPLLDTQRRTGTWLLEQDKNRAHTGISYRDVVGGQTPHKRHSRIDVEKVRKPDPPVAKELTEEEMEKETKAILDEYLDINDMKKTILWVEELPSPSAKHTFVSTAVNYVLQRSAIARNQTGLLLHDLVKKSVLSDSEYIQGLLEVLQFVEEMEIDIPKIWQYFGELIGPMVQDGSVPLSILHKAAEPLKEMNKAGLLVSEVLHAASNTVGHNQVGSLWKQSSLNWSDFMDAAHVDQFIKDKKLEFTAPLPIEKVYRKLHQLMRRKGNNEDIFDLIEENVDQVTVKSNKFIRALMTNVCESAITGYGSGTRVSLEVIKNRGDLLQKYLGHQVEFELQALYAVQALVHKRNHPHGVLRTLFDTLYDEDIISEDGFHRWEKSEDPNEQEGKGIAMKQVVQFFTWLREADEDLSD